MLAGRTEFILIGGLAATVHGSARSTFDIDVVYRRTPENVRRLTTVLEALSPYPRGAPPGLPFRFDPPTVERGMNFTLETTLGGLGLFGDVVGGGRYEDLVPRSQVIEVFGFECRCVTLDALIQLKRAAGRPKDFDVLAELEGLRDRRRHS